MRKNDAFVCKKTLIFGTRKKELFTKDKIYIIDRLQDEDFVVMIQDEDFVVMRDNFQEIFAFNRERITTGEWDFPDYFYTKKELRKQKLLQLAQ